MPNRSILTSTDREFLRKVPNYYEGTNARQSRYQRRRDIRERIVQALLDFEEIDTLLEDDQRRKIFENPESSGAEDIHEFRSAMEHLFQWVYLGYREAGYDFESLLTNSATRAEEKYQQTHGGNIVDVRVKFEVEATTRHSGLEELGEALEQGEPILARSIYKLPTVDVVPVDPDEVDVVRVIPESGNRRPEREKEILETILRAHLGIEAEVEIEGVADVPDSLEDREGEEGEPTAVVSRDEYDDIRVEVSDQPDE
jgi:hypothetical protein